MQQQLINKQNKRTEYPLNHLGTEQKNATMAYLLTYNGFIVFYVQYAWAIGQEMIKLRQKDYGNVLVFCYGTLNTK